MIFLAFSLTVIPESGTLLDSYTAKVTLPEKTATTKETLEEEIRTSGKWGILETSEESPGQFHFLLEPLSPGKLPLLLTLPEGPLFTIVKVAPYTGELPPLPALLPMTPIQKEPLPEALKTSWDAFLADRPRANMEAYEARQIPWRSFLSFLLLLFSLPALLWLFWQKVLVPLSYKSPEQRALEALRALNPKRGTREFPFGLSDAIRSFYENSYAIEATRMTLSELETTLKTSELKEPERHLALLEELEFYKFGERGADSKEETRLYQETESLLREPKKSNT